MSILIKKKIKFTKPKNLEKLLAKMIFDKKIIARFDDRMEFGARSLGNRSILADPRNPKMKEIIKKNKINQK